MTTSAGPTAGPGEPLALPDDPEFPPYFRHLLALSAPTVRATATPCRGFNRTLTVNEWLVHVPGSGWTIARSSGTDSERIPIGMLTEAGGFDRPTSTTLWADLSTLLTHPRLDYAIVAAVLDTLARHDPARADAETMLLALTHPAKAHRVAVLRAVDGDEARRRILREFARAATID